MERQGIGIPLGPPHLEGEVGPWRSRGQRGIPLGIGTFFGDELGCHSHFEGAEDRRVVTGDNVICAPCSQCGWGSSQDGGGTVPRTETRVLGVVTLLTVSVAVDMSLGVRLPEDAVAPGRHVGTHLAGVGGGGGSDSGVLHSPDSPRPSTYPRGLLLVPDVGVPGAPLIAVRWGEGDLLLTCRDSSGSGQSQQQGLHPQTLLEPPQSSPKRRNTLCFSFSRLSWSTFSSGSSSLRLM